MYLREATTRDLHRLCEITITSLKDDPAFDFMWRFRAKYPKDNFFFWQQTLQSWLYGKKHVFIVMVLSASDHDPDSKTNVLSDTIVSYTIWMRQGKSAAARQRWAVKNSLSNRIDAFATRVEIWSTGSKYTRGGADFARLTALEEMGETIEGKFWKDLPERWLLELMVTHVDFQRRGAATELLKWGLKQAHEENIPRKVEVRPMGRLLYAANGFHDLAPFIVSGEGQKESLVIWAMRRDSPASQSP